MREIKFRAFAEIGPVKLMVYNVVVYPGGRIGTHVKDFIEAMPSGWRYDPDSNDFTDGKNEGGYYFVGGEYNISCDDGDWVFFEGIPMQFIGLMDRKRKEIYEDDVIAWDYEYDADYDGDMPIVKRSTGRAAVKDMCGHYAIRRAKEEGDGVEVIGNIHQNPELLGKD
jgi:hypothetical protein